jgi:hypothetical protein
MYKLEFNDREMAYLLVALRKHEEALLASEEEEAGDAVTDLLVIQALRRKIKEAKDRADA